MLKKLKKRSRNEQSTLQSNAVSTKIGVSDKNITLLSIDTVSKKASIALADEAQFDENGHPTGTSNHHLSKRPTRTESGARHETSSPSATTATATPVRMSRAKLEAMVRQMDEKAKEEYAWQIHNFQKRKNQTQLWYDFKPPERYCSNNAFVPIRHKSLIPSDTSKNLVKTKTRSLVLSKGIQGHHFAIGWQELFGMLIEYGVFADPNPNEDPAMSNKIPGGGIQLPYLLDFQPPDLPKKSIMGNSPTKGIITTLLCESSSSKSRKATLGVKYTTTPSPQEEILLPTVGTKRKSADHVEWIPLANNANRAKKPREDSTRKSINIVTTDHQQQESLVEVDSSSFAEEEEEVEKERKVAKFTTKPSPQDEALLPTVGTKRQSANKKCISMPHANRAKKPSEDFTRKSIIVATADDQKEESSAEVDSTCSFAEEEEVEKSKSSTMGFLPRKKDTDGDDFERETNKMDKSSLRYKLRKKFLDRTVFVQL